MDLAAAGFAVGLAVAAAVAMLRGLQGRPDWKHWEEETQALLGSGDIADHTAMYGYLPGFFVVLAPFAGIPPRWAAVPVFVASNLAALAVAIAAVRDRWMGGVAASQSWWWRLLFAVLVLMPVSLFEPLGANQLSLWILALCAAGLGLVRSGRGFAGGLLLGTACLIKPMPGMLVLFCAWKRHWSAVAGAALAGAVLDPGLCTVYFGFLSPDEQPGDRTPLVHGAMRTVEEHREYLVRTARHSWRWFLEEPLYYRRNQSVPAVLGRLLRAMPPAENYVLVAGPLPEEQLRERLAETPGSDHVFRAPVPPHGVGMPTWTVTVLPIARYPHWNVADLPVDAVRGLYLVFLAGVVGLLLWSCRGAGRAIPDDRTWYAQASLWLVSMFWLTPYLTALYYVWLFPALAVLVERIVRDADLSRRRRGVLIAAVAVWTAAQPLRFWLPGEFYGGQMWATFALGAGLLTLVRPGSAAGPADAVSPAAAPQGGL